MHKLHEMFEKLEECASNYLDRGTEQVDTQEMSMVVDMIKDLAEAMYYYGTYEAMQDYINNPEQERYGYDRYRYANGRYAPKGRGRRMGYEEREPYMHMQDDEWDMDEYGRMRNYRMGYSDNGNNQNGGNSQSGYNQGGGNNQSGYSQNNRYGNSYGRYDSYRKHYHDTNNEDSKRKMQESINDVFEDMESMVQDIAKEMTPTEKDKYRQKLNMMMQKIQ